MVDLENGAEIPDGDFVVRTIGQCFHTAAQGVLPGCITSATFELESGEAVGQYSSHPEHSKASDVVVCFVFGPNSGRQMTFTRTSIATRSGLLSHRAWNPFR